MAVMKVAALEAGEGSILARLAVIESKLEALLAEIAAAREDRSGPPLAINRRGY